MFIIVHGRRLKTDSERHGQSVLDRLDKSRKTIPEGELDFHASRLSRKRRDSNFENAPEISASRSLILSSSF